MTRNRGAALALASVLVLTMAAPAHADGEATGAVLVAGKIGTRERSVIESAIKTELRRASWLMNAQPFTANETEVIRRCLADDGPWYCLGPLLQPKGVDRIMIAEVSRESDSASKLVITGEYVVAGAGPAAVRQRPCDRCDDQHLSDAAQRLTADLLADMQNRSETLLEFQISPAGATVLIDGQAIGKTDLAGKLSHAALPGPHKITVRHGGFVNDDREVVLPVARTTHVDIRLTAIEARPAVVTHRRSLVAPITVTGAGVLALGTGIAFQLAADSPPAGQQQPRYIVSTPGVLLMTGGGLAIGVAAYLWLRSNDRAAPGATATATLVDRGAIIGWTGPL